jgi:hypothetical protein
MTYKRWTKEEDLILKTMASFCTTKELAERLNRSEYSVKGRLLKLGIRLREERDFIVVDRSNTWTDEELAYLRSRRWCMSGVRIANKLGKTHSAVKSKASRLGLTLNPRGWKDEQVEQLEALIEDGLSWSDIGEALGKTATACRKKAYDLMLETKTKTKKWTDEEKDELLKMKEDGLSWKDISEKLNRKKSTVQKMYWRLTQ